MRLLKIEGDLPRQRALTEKELGEGAGRGVPRKLALNILEESRKSAIEMSKRARWKVTVLFHSQRSDHKLMKFSLSVWESGKRLHGGGDESAFFCRRRVPVRERPKDIAAPATPMGCGAVIPGSLVQIGGLVVCPNCRVPQRTKEIADTLFYTADVQRSSEVLAEWWAKCGGDADIVLMYCASDIRVLAQMKDGDEGMRKARESRGMLVYPLARIIKDTANGATIESRMKALILA
jgi:hypothetical protein